MARETEVHKTLNVKTHYDAILHTCWNESWNFALGCDTFFAKFLTNTLWKHL